MPGISDDANRPLPSMPIRSFSWMRIFLHYLSSRLPSFDKCLEKRSKKFTVTNGDEQATSAVAISNDQPQLAQSKQIAFVVLVCLPVRLRCLPDKPTFGARQPVAAGLGDPRGAGCLAAK